jgi:hypothetical protein
MHNGSDPASPDTSDLLIAYLQLLLVNLKKIILQLFVTPCDRLLEDLPHVDVARRKVLLQVTID